MTPTGLLGNANEQGLWMTLKIRYASHQHLGWLAQHDSHIQEMWRLRCLKHQEYVVAELGDEPVGFLRFSWFWGHIPYMDMIQVLPKYRRSGAGTALFTYWEKAMHSQGAELLMTSSVQDELEPQAWHRRNGFHPAGSVTFAPLQTVPELFLVKPLGMHPDFQAP